MTQGPLPSTLHTAPIGWVYIIVNDLIPSRVKIGYTERDPIVRAAELVTTGTTGTFVVIYHALVDYPYDVERRVHKQLAAWNVGLEWFAICPNRAKETILSVAGTVHHEITRPRWPASQTEPREETKVLLEEARQAAEEQRRRLEAARIAEEQERLRAETLRQQQEEEAARQLAERLAEQEREQIRVAEEQIRLARENAQRLQREKVARDAEITKRNRARRNLAKRWAARGLVATMLAMPFYYAYRTFGPYPASHLEALTSRLEEAKQAVADAQVAGKQLADLIATAKRDRTVVSEKQSQLAQSIADEERKHKLASLELRVAKDRQKEARDKFAPDGTIRQRDGLPLRTVESHINALDRDVSRKQKVVQEASKELDRMRAELASLPEEAKSRLKKSEQLSVQAVKCSESLERARADLRQAEEALSDALRHNRQFSWINF
jgi:hypothetical protein